LDEVGQEHDGAGQEVDQSAKRGSKKAADESPGLADESKSGGRAPLEAPVARKRAWAGWKG
jgi:hypothetical protein